MLLLVGLRRRFVTILDLVFGSLGSLPAVPLAAAPTSVEELPRLRSALGARMRLLVKRDDAIGFAFGGNKVRKMRLVAGEALAKEADTLITCGGVQSNHARVTAATAAKLGLRSVLIANGEPPERLTANALLNRLVGAEVRYVDTREARAPAMERAAAELRRTGHRPYIIPIGASTPLGAAAFVHAIAELLEQIPAPDVIVHATSSGGTQAGLIAGCTMAGIHTRIIGVSADASAASLGAEVRRILNGLGSLLGFGEQRFERATVEIDDSFVGGGYAVPTAESHEALELVARTEGLVLDPTYTSKAMAGLIARVRRNEFPDEATVLFWHTGGQVGLFA
jgi:D-cysteine desulfhydrase family pyridoxal phosphate-dependent enzyme